MYLLQGACHLLILKLNIMFNSVINKTAGGLAISFSNVSKHDWLSSDLQYMPYSRNCVYRLLTLTLKKKTLVENFLLGTKCLSYLSYSLI